jgi:hypothetical protein
MRSELHEQYIHVPLERCVCTGTVLLVTQDVFGSSLSNQTNPILTAFFNSKVHESIPVKRRLSCGLRPLAYWDYGFESHRGHGCLSLVIVV